MTRLPAAVLLCFLLALPALAAGRVELNPPPAPPNPDRPIAIVGATLIDGTGAPPIPDSAVIIRGNLIEAVGRRSDADIIPPNASTIFARGQTLTPGLIDQHFHSVNDNAVLAAYLRNGVTSIREPGHPLSFYQSLNFAEGPLPRCFLVGAHLDGYPPVWPQQAAIIRDADHARAVVNSHADSGAAGIKIYFRLPLDLYAPVIEAAHARSIPVTAHLELVPADAAIRAGLDGLEHVTSFGPALAEPDVAAAYYHTVEGENDARGKLRYRMWADLNLDTDRAKALIQLTVERNIAVCPTLAVYERRPGDQGVEDYEVEGFANMVRFTGMLHRAGAKIVMGSHTWVPHAGYGRAAQRELELLVEAGLTPLEAIAAATGRSAANIGAEDRLGAIAPGKQADILLVQGDASADIAVMSKVSRVMQAGRWVLGGQ